MTTDETADETAAAEGRYAHSFRLGALAPVENGDLAREMIFRAHRYYNQLVEIERWRRSEVEAHWAQQGGYADALVEDRERIAELLADAKRAKDKAERRSLFATADETRRKIYDRQRETILAASDTPEARRRKERGKELRAEARAAGKKLSVAELTALLDAEPDCVSPRDKLRLDLTAEAKRAGKKVHAPTLAKALRAAGFVSPTDAIDTEAKRRDYAAYQESGIFHGTRAIVAERFAKSVAACQPDPPDFRRWEHAGALGVSFVHADNVTWHELTTVGTTFARIELDVEEPRKAAVDALSWSDLLARGWTRDQVIQHASRRSQRTLRNVQWLETQLRIQRRPGNRAREHAAPSTQPGSRRAGKRARLWLRIGSDDDRKPVWTVIPIVLDRMSIPSEARIMTIRAYVERVGLHDEWHVVFGTSLTEPVRRRAPAGSGVVAIDFCWRRLPDGTLRAGYWCDSDGQSGSLDVPERSIRRTDKVRDLDQIQSRMFAWSTRAEDDEPPAEGGIVADLSAWLTGRSDLPEWLTEMAPHVARWRSGARLARLIERWLENRFDGDDEIVRHLDKWRRDWRHLREWEARQERSALAHRLEIFRAHAKALCDAHETVIVRDLDLAAMKRVRSDLVKRDDAVRSVMTTAAPGELRESIVRAAGRRARLLVKLEDAALPVRCHACGNECEWDRAAKLVHTCEHCGATWDQHENVARNMLAMHRERFGGDETPGGARKAPKTRKPRVKSASHEARDTAAE